ncbi:flagellar hook-associated protein 2 [Pelosinus fermentans]|uniref:flagellar filament capping protein FliD n=1 Tax=Pelosinus fermentans TaxID=365349 RepID=UPI0002685EA4|nr:flagellar filament capping protein FliD [Pelosinus fermentans]OAM92847.1 flagellar hook-associated 2 domain-containing protein [Pelosinus fermentans DSM 17108]SDQ58773.1 flagellar hook-associated protein 2 [Pelosinus fermentans]
MASVSSTSSTTLSLSTTTSSSLGSTHLNSTVGGLDIDALISATIAAKSLPITLLQNKNAVLQAKVNDYTAIKTALKTLQYAAKDLTYASSFTGRKATSSDTDVVTASATNGGTNGSYTIKVTSMASITSNSSSAVGNGGRKATVTSTAAGIVGTDTINEVGEFTINGKRITVAASDTFDNIISQINAASAGVTASLSDGKVTITQNKAAAASTIELIDTNGLLDSKLHIKQADVITGIDDTSGGTYTTVTGNNAFTPAKLNDTITDYAASGITVGSFVINNKSISVTSTDTINTIANKITASGANVKATVDTDGKITLTQKTAGKDAAITLGTDTTGFFDAAGITQQAATDGLGKDSDTTSLLKDVTGLDGVTKGYFSINGTFFSVDPEKDTVESIIKKINASTTAGVSAFYDSTTHKISLTSQTAGNTDIKLGTSSTDSSNFLSQVGLVQTNQQTGADAVVTVNGISATATNNKITYQGNTFTLVGEGTSTVTVNDDIDAMVTKVQNFITAYNAAMDSIVTKITEKADSSSTDASVGDLFGDSTLRGLEQSLRNFSSTILSSQASTMQQLSQVGITTGTAGTYDIAKVQSGHLELDETKLRAALTADPKAVETLFGNTTVSIDEEKLGTNGKGDGSTKTFTLKHGIDIIGDPTIKVGTKTYTLVAAADLKTHVDTTPPGATETNEYQFSFDSSTGKVTLNYAPNSSDGDITVSYDYDVESGSNAGIFVQMNAQLTNYTQYGGTLDMQAGSNGYLAKNIEYNNDRITDLKYRLSQEQATLYTKYQNMQTTLQGLQSQGSYITALLASLTKSSS